MISTLQSPPTPHRAASPNLPYLGGIDGLRAISVMAVIAYHSQIGGISGGFLGVEVFFAISGYLITTLLFGEHKQHGRIDLKQFWFRRGRRLLPALYVLLASTVVLAALFAPDAMERLRRDIVAALLYISNWWLIVANDSYFAQAGRPPLLRNLWSLAVEEQFYLLWPIVVGLLIGRVRRSWLVTGTVAVGLGSAFAMAVAFNPEIDPSALYYGTTTRLSGLLLGSAFAMIWRPSLLRSTRRSRGVRWFLDAVAVGGLIGLVAMFVTANEFDPFVYRGGFVLVDIATICVIAAVVHPSTRIGGLLGIGLLRWIGLRSYGLYLWHWPIFQLTRPDLDVNLGGFGLFALRFVLVVGATELSYRFVEQPIRHGALGRWWSRRHETTNRAQLRFRTLMTVGVAVPITALALLVWGPSASAANTLAGEAAKAARTAPLLTVATTSVAPTTTTSAPTTADPAAAATVEPPTEPPTTAPPAPPPPQPIVGLADTPDPPTTTAPSPALAATPVTVSAIGDSVMVGSRRALERNIPGIFVNAVTSRQFGDVREVIAGMLAFNTLGHVVLIHLGTNGVITDGMLDDVMRAVGPDRVVYFITPKVPRPWEGIDNERLHNAAGRWPTMRIIDWYTASVNNPELFVKDGAHLTPKGVIAYTQLVLNSFN